MTKCTRAVIILRAMGAILSRHFTLLRTPIVSVITIAIGTAGCAVNDADEVALYRQVLDGDDASHIEYAAGEPLSLVDAMQLASQHHERLAIQGEEYVQVLVEKDRAASAFFPTISFVPSYSKADDDGDGGARRVTGGGVVDDNELRNRSGLSTGDGRLDAPVNLNVNVFRGFRDVANVRRAKADIEQFRALLLDLQAQVLLDVAQAYYAVLRAEQSARVLRESSQVQDERVRDVRARDQAGAARKLDVAQTEAQAADTRATLVVAEADVVNARALLAFLVAAPVSNAPLVDRLEPPAAVLPVEDLVAMAQSQRMDLQAAEANARAAAQVLQGAIGQYYPSVSINFNYYLSRESNPEDSMWNGLISANVPIFTAGFIKANVRAAASQLRQAKLQQQMLLRQIEQEVTQAHVNLMATTRRLAELRIAVEAAQQGMDVAQGEYTAGRGTYLDRLVAQDVLLSAQLQETAAQYNRKFAYLNLLRVQGGLTRPPKPDVLGAASATQPATTTTAPTTAPSTRPLQP